jgi:hypothetical protein
MLAHSDRLVLPRITAPASFSRRATGASRRVTLPARASEPAVVAVPSSVSILSFTSTGMPCSPPRTAPALRSPSSRRASSSARGLTAMTLRSVGPERSIVSILAR